VIKIPLTHGSNVPSCLGPYRVMVILFLRRQVGLPMERVPCTLIPLAANWMLASPKTKADVAGTMIVPKTKEGSTEQDEMRTFFPAGSVKLSPFAGNLP